MYPQPQPNTHYNLYTSYFWGGVGVILTTAKKKLFLYRVLHFDFCFNLKKLLFNIVNLTSSMIVGLKNREEYTTAMDADDVELSCE